MSNSSSDRVNPEELLSHRGFMRAIAQSLLKEEHQAEDAVQDAWMAVLKQPSLKVRSLRDWLAAVTRNFARKRMRDESRRRSREQTVAADQPKVVCPTEEIVEKEMTRRRVVTAVLSLKEPNCSTILFRYYENLSLREIGELYDLPIRTVQSRIQRGLNQLRKKLREEYGGDGKSLCMALVPLAGLTLASRAAAVSAGSGAGTSGIIWKLGLATLLIVGGLFTLPLLFNDSHSTDSSPARFTEPLVDSQGTPRGERNGMSVNQDERIPGGDERTALKPTSIPFSGQVRDLGTNEPIQAYNLLLLGSGRDGSPTGMIHDTVRDEEGRFSYTLDLEGSYELVVRSSRHCMNTLTSIEISRENRPADIELMLEPGIQISGKVIDDATGAPLAHALVGSSCTPFPLPSVEGFGSELDRGYEEAEVHACTDLAGHFFLSGLDDIPQRIVATHPGYAQSWESYLPGEGHEVVIRMKKGHRIFGEVVNAKGEPLEGAAILMEGERFPLRRKYHTDPQGRFETEPAQAGMIYLDIYPLGDDLRKFGNDPVRKGMHLSDQDMEVLLSCVPDHCITWQGRLHNGEGAPVKSGIIMLYPVPDFLTTSVVNLDSLPSFSARVDEEGGFTVTGFPPGGYHVFIGFGREGREQRVDAGNLIFDTPANGIVQRDLFLGGSSVQGVVFQTGGMPFRTDRGIVIAEGGEDPERSVHKSMIDEEGRFLLTGLGPGKYKLKVRDSICDHFSGWVKEIQLDENQALKDIEMAVSWQGRIRIKVVDLEDFNYVHSILSIKGPGRDLNILGGMLDYSVETKSAEITLPFEAGIWFLSFSYRLGNKTGFLERKVQVEAGQSTEILLSESNLRSFTQTLSVKGYLSFCNSSPAEETELIIIPTFSNIVGVAASAKLGEISGCGIGEIKVVTDLHGEFEIHEITPGPWNVRVIMSDGSRVVLQDQLIPAGRGDPYLLYLEIPGGVVSGRLCNAENKRLLHVDDSGFQVLFFPLKENLEPAEMWDDPEQAPLYWHFDLKGNDFRISGIETGSYLLVIDVRGYALYQHEIPFFREGESLSIPKINLDACGVVDLELMDSMGRPLESFSLYCNGRSYGGPHGGNYYSPIIKLSPSRYLCDKLPLGPVKLEIRARGFKTRSLTLYLKAGERARARLEFSSEE